MLSIASDVDKRPLGWARLHLGARPDYFTVTPCVTEAVRPSASVIVSVPVYVPESLYMWVVVEPFPVDH